MMLLSPTHLSVPRTQLRHEDVAPDACHSGTFLLCVFSTSETDQGFFRTKVKPPAHRAFGLPPIPDCAGTGDLGLPVFAPSSA